MGIRSTIKKGISFGFQPRRWFGVEHVKANGKICVDLLNDLVSETKRSEATGLSSKTEAEDIQKNPKALKFRQRLALCLTCLYTLAAIGAVLYGLNLIVVKSFILSGCVCFILSFLFFIYSLREFMVYAQIRSGLVKRPLKALIKLALKGFPQ